MADPGKIAIRPQDVVPFIRNKDTGLEDEWWRCQRADPVVRRGITTHFQLGQKDPVGTTVEAPEYTVTVEHFMHDMTAELIMAGKTPGMDTSYNLGDLLAQDDLRINLLERGEGGQLKREYEFDDGMVAAMTWTFGVRAPSSVTSQLSAILGKAYYYGGSMPHNAYPTDATTSPGAILGRDARVRFATDDADGRAYRLQGFTIRGAYPVDTIRELGRRALVGILSRMPTVTVDFDLLSADIQPHSVFFGAVAGAMPYYDFGDPQIVDMFIRLYDPDLAEANTVIRAWKLENAKTGDVSPMSVNVGGLAATRYTLQLGKPDTADSCGVICYLGDIPA